MGINSKYKNVEFSKFVYTVEVESYWIKVFNAWEGGLEGMFINPDSTQAELSGFFVWYGEG